MNDLTLPSETLAELIGKPYTYKSRAWIKILGVENTKYYKQTNNVDISRSYIWQEYNKTCEQGAVTPEMAQILMYAYVHWTKNRAGNIDGMIADHLHDAILTAFATFYKIKMKTDSPFHSILNLLNKIKSQTMYKFFGDVSGTKNKYYQRRHTNELLSATDRIDLFDEHDDEERHDNFCLERWDWDYGYDRENED